MTDERNDRQWRIIRAYVLSRSDTCGICGHPGSQDADHIIPPSRGGEKYAVENLQPAHGVGGCPLCGRKCNQEKSDKLPSELGNGLRTSRDWYTPPPVDAEWFKMIEGVANAQSAADVVEMLAAWLTPDQITKVTDSLRDEPEHDQQSA